MSSIFSGLYSTFVQRNSIFLGTIFVGAFATNIALDTAANSVWDTVNRGRQWKDIKQRYMQAGDEEEDEDE